MSGQCIQHISPLSGCLKASPLFGTVDLTLLGDVKESAANCDSGLFQHIQSTFNQYFSISGRVKTLGAAAACVHDDMNQQRH